MLEGKKAYLVGILMGLAGAAYGLGWIDEGTFKTLEGILLGGGIMALRAGIAKTQ